MPRIRIGQRVITAQDGQSLLEALAAAGVLLRADCGGRGRCGKCRVRVATAGRQAAGESDAEEAAQLGAEALAAGFRLACRLRPAGDLSVEIPPASRLSPEVARKGPPLLFQRLARRPSKASAAGGRFGLAVDLGTTTIAAYLCDRRRAQVTAAVAVRNPQAVFGDDVMSRISAVRADPGRLGRLQALAAGALDWAAATLCRAARLAAGEIGRLVVAGNPTMLHLLLGEDPSPIGVHPYRPRFTESRRLAAGDAGLQFLPRAELLTLPLVSGFVGADTVAAALACELTERPPGTLLVDVGTNGEIMARADHATVATSCATGPAFEGAVIRHGMQALSGAVEAVRIEPATGRLDCRLVQHDPYRPRPPAGLCGSGVVSAVAAMRRACWLKPDGAFDRAAIPRRLLCEDGGDTAILLVPAGQTQTGGPITLTQKDVRAVQLAKGALRAGIELLDRRLGLQRPQHLMLAGAFGSSIEIADALTIGMFPPMPEQAVAVVGNAAGAGAILALMDEALLQQATELCERIEVLELAEQPGFQETFIASLGFP